LFGKQKKIKQEERRRQGPKYEKMRKEFEQKVVTTQTLKQAQAQTQDINSRIENLRRIARLGSIKS